MEPISDIAKVVMSIGENLLYLFCGVCVGG